jgi:hypothetical protein
VLDVIASHREQRLVHITLETGERLTATDGHPFKTSEGWRDAIMLKKGGKLLLKGAGEDDAENIGGLAGALEGLRKGMGVAGALERGTGIGTGIGTLVGTLDAAPQASSLTDREHGMRGRARPWSHCKARSPSGRDCGMQSIKMLNIYFFLFCVPLMMGFWFAFGSGSRDASVTRKSTEWGAPSYSRRCFTKMAIMLACLLAEGAIADYLGILRNEARLGIFLMTTPFGIIAGIFIKFRNFSWWRNCRIAKWFY